MRDEQRLDLGQRKTAVPLALLDEGHDVVGKLGPGRLRLLEQLGYQVTLR